MRLLIHTPAARGSTKGNRITADRWGRLLRDLGHQVTIRDSTRKPTSASFEEFDVLIALHAVRSAFAIQRFRARHPNRPLILCMTGTDIHRDLVHGKQAAKTARQSMTLADRIVLLEPQATARLPRKYQARVRVIYQSAIQVTPKPKPLNRWFEISILGHLRPEKDPFLAADSARLLPAESRIKIIHLGKALSEKSRKRAEKETQTNPRYRWIGGRTHLESQRILARSRVTVLSSVVEGAPSVISEAIVNDVPILTTEIDASIGLLGNDFPGLFPVGEVERLANLLRRSETDPRFLKQLRQAGRIRRSQFTPAAEKKSWRQLLAELDCRRVL